MASVNFTIDGPVARVVLNRPEALNAIDSGMDAQLYDVWTEVNRNPEVRVVVLSGTGDRAFCAGGDISEVDPSPQQVALGGGLTGIGGELLTLRKPLIAAVHGFVLGGGFELALCADIIVAADTAVFSMPEVKIGIMAGPGVMHRAIRQLPHRVAMAMILTGERLSAEEALHYGLVNESVSYGELRPATERWVEKLLAVSPLAAQAAKDAVLSSQAHPIEVALSTRYPAIDSYAASADHREGRHAFVEKRRPKWRGE
ncbi:enoyl-CoA hydratase-related protein [Arthrobacter mobilis]|uniref:Crotonase n=1 Tax=Arthrobacter mobilis TaxID=2724944 RepID=A0A7X6HEW6_9MICC|nr:enoyl-CoA hydratase-related protein [Arthrobacter mobilis]NKX55879.1 crotonase [Arthrobacter mobilis]